MEEEEEMSPYDIVLSVFGKQSQPTATGQRQKEETTLTERKPIIKTVLFIEARVIQRTSPLESTRTALATVSAELSGNSGIKNLKIRSNRNRGGPKPITSIAMIPLEWDVAKKYITCLNETTGLTKRITGNKPRIFKLVITLGSEINIA